MTRESVCLVTGASGFIGRRLCERLRGAGTVRALFRRDAEGPWDEACRMDLADETPLEGAVRGVDVVFHLAGRTDDSRTAVRDAALFHRVNCLGTSRLFQAAASSGVGRIVYLSSVKAMGSAVGVCMNEDDPGRPTTPYGCSKRAAEEVVLGGGIAHACVLRACPVYGRGSKGNLARMIRAMARGLFPPLPDTRNARSMVHVDDLVDALLLAATKPEARGRIFLVTDGTPYSTRQIYEWVREAMGRGVPRWSIPAFALRTAGKVGDAVARASGGSFPFTSGLVERLLGSSCYDSTLIERTLGFEPKRHLRESLPEMIRASANARSGGR